MKNDSNHPARSPDFLSRLHDGDLTAGERAHFESHRAHCGECRRAASEFEKALSLFRATSTSAPPSDLSARILRKLQASTPRQARFGIVHGINMKWAAGFAVAVIAAVVGFSVVLERESARREILRQTPIPVLLEKEKSRSGGTASVPPRLDAQGRSAEAPRGSGPAPRREAFAPDVRAADNAPPPPPPVSLKKAQPSGYEAREAAAETSDSVAPRRPDAASSGFARNREHVGGEGAAASSAASPEPGAPARLVVLPLDGEGTVPEVISPDAADLLVPLRGKRYVLLVEAGGRVREAKPDERGKRGARPDARRSLENAGAPPSVWTLRFAPGDRPRRLLLRVE